MYALSDVYRQPYGQVGCEASTDALQLRNINFYGVESTLLHLVESHDWVRAFILL